MIKVKFKRGFSLNGTWYEKHSVETLDTKTAEALLKKSVVSKVEDSAPKAKEGK